MGFNIFGWFTKDKVKLLENMAKTIGKLFLGSLATAAWETSKDAVWRAEQSGLSGEEKFEMAYTELRGIVSSKTTGKWVLSLLLEIAVGVMKAQKGLI